MPESHRVQRGRASKRQHGLLAVTVCLYGKVKSRVIQHTRKRGQVRREGFGQYGVVVTWWQTGGCRIGGLESQKPPDSQVVFLFTKPCRMTGVYDKGACGVYRTGCLVRFPRG
jgi:hypothetical protein